MCSPVNLPGLLKFKLTLAVGGDDSSNDDPRSFHNVLDRLDMDLVWFMYMSGISGTAVPDRDPFMLRSRDKDEVRRWMLEGNATDDEGGCGDSIGDPDSVVLQSPPIAGTSVVVPQ